MSYPPHLRQLYRYTGTESRGREVNTDEVQGPRPLVKTLGVHLGREDRSDAGDGR